MQLPPTVTERAFSRLAEIGARVAPFRMWDIRGLGAMLAVEFVTDFDTAKPDAALTNPVVAPALERGLILLACGMHGHALRIMVPLTASDEIVEEGLAIFEAALADALVLSRPEFARAELAPEFLIFGPRG